jgi:hypothetical protein
MLATRPNGGAWTGATQGDRNRRRETTDLAGINEKGR